MRHVIVRLKVATVIQQGIIKQVSISKKDTSLKHDLHILVYVYLKFRFSLDEQEEILNDVLDVIEVNGKIRETQNTCNIFRTVNFSI